MLQIIPAIAQRYGMESLLDPEANIQTATRLMNDLIPLYSEAEETDRIRFALAAYNMVAGHIADGRHLAKRMGLNANRWSSLERTLPILTDQKYNRNAQFVYCRGFEAVQYVQRVMIYYDIMKRSSLGLRSARQPDSKIH